MHPAVMETTGQLDRGIWYRRKNGQAYTAKWIAARAIEVTPMAPGGVPETLFDEHFFCFYCRELPPCSAT